MFEDELPESDSSDEDFVPTGERSDVSEEESDDAIDENASEQNVTNKRKKTKSKSIKTNSKRRKKDVEKNLLIEGREEEQPKEEANTEAVKKRADALWADFLKDCGPTKKTPEALISKPALSRPTSSQENTKNVKKVKCIAEDISKSDSSSESLKNIETNGNLKNQEDKIQQGSSDKVVEVYEFAGEKVVVEKKMDPRKRPALSKGGGGVAALLSQINKKSKLSTLEKSKLDWDSFKDKEGINEELSAHNRGKNGYLEKQDFLERADLRQFEIEKEMRAYNRSKRF